LARVFGSSHGSQDDAFKRGREMGYDSGYLEGRRTAKPVVVPMLRVVGGDTDTPIDPREPHRPGAERDQQMPVVARDDQMPGVARDQQLRGVARDQDPRAAAGDQENPVRDLGVRDLEHVGGVRFTPPLLPVWRREAPEEVVGWDRVVAWMRPRRIPLLAAAVSLALVGVFLVGTAMARPSTPVEALHPSPGPGSLFDRTVPSQGTTPALLPASADSRDSFAVLAGASPFSTTTAGLSPVAPTLYADSAAVLASASSSPAGLASAPISPPAVAVVAPAIDPLPAVTPPSAAPVVAAPVVPLTAAEQTAADAAAAAALTKANALAAANLTKANAKAAADRTAANAKAAADLTAANAAAAAAATAQAAADAAWAVAHP
ncbi:MAG: hypothetical protein ABI662_12950, partial [Dermatophilaceae bacterium]